MRGNVSFSNPYKLEYFRQSLAAKGEYGSLLSTYKKDYPQIKNLNSPSFWDNKLYTANEFSFDIQDGMTKDRVNTAVKYIPDSCQKILDIGAGNGYLEEKLSNKKFSIYANDISPKAVSNLKIRFKGEFRVESIYKMKYPKHFFDCVCLLEVLEHIPPKKTFYCLKKIRSILKRNGYLIISVPTNEGLDKMKDNPNGHLRMYSKDLIFAELELSGFHPIKHKTFYAFQKYYLMKKLISHLLTNKWEPNNIIILAKAL